MRITDEALDAAAELSGRCITDRFLPDKAIVAGGRLTVGVQSPAPAATV